MNASEFLKSAKRGTVPGLVLWEGPSAFDGTPIVAILTGFRKSSNRKTGAMLQTYIIRQDVKPTEALKAGLDVATCGDCPFRSKASGGCGACYVNCGQGPRAVFEAYKAGRYAKLGKDVAGSQLGPIVSGYSIRFGAYGDPVATDLPGLFNIMAEAAAHTTGYTHAWRSDSLALPRGDRASSKRVWRQLVMASCDTPEDVIDARLDGWRTFRVRLPEESLIGSKEIACPASKEGGERVQCANCGLCNGRKNSSDPRADIAIIAHGSSASNYSKWRAHE